MERSRFGELAVEAGYLQPADVRRVERIQAEDLREGRVPRPLGIICLQEGLMTYAQVVVTLERAERKAGRMAQSRNLVPRRHSARTLPSRRPERLATVS